MELLKMKAELDELMHKAAAARQSEHWQELANILDDAADLAEHIAEAHRETRH